MPIGYLVILGNGSLGAGDVITASQSTFTSQSTIGSGSWTWSGIWSGDNSYYANITDTGTYQIGTDGNVYFVPTTWNITSGTASATSGPAFDPIEGTSGDDVLGGTAGADTIYGGATTDPNGTGDDTISAGGGNDLIFSGDGNDVIKSGSGNDVVHAGSGNDTLIGGTGADTLDGGAGNDTADYSASSGAINISLSGGTASGGNATGDILSGIENVTGSGFADKIIGDTGSNVLDGGAANDTLVGSDGDDSISGGDGNDLIGVQSLAPDPALLNWGSGTANGSFTVNGSSNTVNVTVATDTNALGQTADVTSNGTPAAVGLWVQGIGEPITTTMTFDNAVSNVTFEIYDLDSSVGGWDDAITILAADANGNQVDVNFSDLDGLHSVSGNTLNADGNASGDVETSGAPDSVTVTIPGPLTGLTFIFDNGESVATSGMFGVGNMSFDIETVANEDGNDTLDGGGGNDTIFAGQGDDAVDGGTGDDSIYGGDGADTISGGAGSDILHLGAGDGVADTVDLNDGDGGDIVFDFVVPTDNGDGTYTGYDKFDVSGLTDALGNPVNAFDVTVTDTNGDGTGDAILNFPNGETVTLVGVTVDQVDNRAELRAMGIPCFAKGTLIATPDGEVAIEKLGIGDLVLTMDSGYQPLRWIGSKDVTAYGNLAPIRICKGVLNNQRDLFVSPQHRVLLRSAEAELMFGESEVLAAAKHLVNGTTVTREEGGGVVYFHMLFDKHEIVFSEGIPTESFHPSDQALDALAASARDEILALFPDLADRRPDCFTPTARLCLKQHEAALIANRLALELPSRHLNQPANDRLALSA